VAAQASPDLEILRAQIAQQGDLIRQLLAERQQAAAKPEGTAAAADAEIKVPPYNFNIPDELVNAMADENPGVRKAAISALIQGTGQAIHREVVKAIRAEIPEVARRVSMEESRAGTASQNIFNDFYNKYPQYRTPEAMEIVKVAAAEVMRETGLTTWNEPLRDAIAMRTQTKIQKLMTKLPASPAKTQAAPVAPKTPPTPRQPAAFLPGARAPQAKGNDVASQVADLLGL
jgi:hypothetical protein